VIKTISPFVWQRYNSLVEGAPEELLWELSRFMMDDLLFLFNFTTRKEGAVSHVHGSPQPCQRLRLRAG